MPAFASRKRSPDANSRLAARRPAARAAARPRRGGAVGCRARRIARAHGAAGRSAIDLARDVLIRFGGLARSCAAPVADVAAVPGFGPARSVTFAAAAELVRRSLAECARARDALGLAAGSARLSPSHARSASLRGLHRPLSRQPESRARVRGAVPGHARADQRVSARGRQGGAGAQRGGDDLRAQSSVRGGRAEPRRRAARPRRSSRRWRWSTSARSITSSSPAVSSTSFAERGLL